LRASIKFHCTKRDGKIIDQRQSARSLDYAILDDDRGNPVHKLIALAITPRCNGCIAVHTKAGVEKGTREEIAEAPGVAIALNASAALTWRVRDFQAA
jgi:AhpD family alkylhydroperoxidase